MSVPLLSICIPTLNRGRVIGQTLQSIAAQKDDRFEVVIVDGGSTDDTERVVAGFASSIPRLRYLKSTLGSSVPSNEGFDRDCNLAVESAKGEYCWLMTDDDLMSDDAVGEVCARLPRQPDLVFVCSKICSLDFNRTLEPALPRLDSDREYGRTDWVRCVRELGPHLTLVARVVVKRSVWLARPRDAYFGTGFVHVGVILCQAMDRVIAISRPLLVIRYGDALWRPRAFDIWMLHWPRLIWSFRNLPEEAKHAITSRYPFRRLSRLIWYRALGAYTFDKYRQHLSTAPGAAFRCAAALIARAPASLANTLCSLYFAANPSKPHAVQLYDLLHCGHAALLTRRLARRRGLC
jgi:glycosyltransferase involved in cell wall biosynthesis